MGAGVLRCFQQGALQSQPGRYGRSALALGVPATQSVRPGFQHALILKQSGLQEDPLEGLHPACRPPRWRGEPEGHAQCLAAVWTALRGVGSPGSKSARLERAWGDAPHAGRPPEEGGRAYPAARPAPLWARARGASWTSVPARSNRRRRARWPPGRPSQQDKSPRRHRLILGRSVQKHPVHKGNRSPA